MRYDRKSTVGVVQIWIVLSILVLVSATGHGLMEIEEVGFWLITPEEAGLPPALVDPYEVRQRGLEKDEPSMPDTGPVIQVEKPETEEAHPSPLEILIRFTPRQAPVDLSTLNVTLVKFFNIDLTGRVRPYTSPDGIHIQDAKLPSGEHTLRLTLADMDGGLTTEEISLRVM